MEGELHKKNRNVNFTQFVQCTFMKNKSNLKKGQKEILVTTSQNQHKVTPLFSSTLRSSELTSRPRFISQVAKTQLTCFLSSVQNICEIKCLFWTSFLITATYKSPGSHANFPPRSLGKLQNKVKKWKKKNKSKTDESNSWSVLDNVRLFSWNTLLA